MPELSANTTKRKITNQGKLCKWTCLPITKLPLHCRLSQQMSNCEKGRGHFSRELNTSMQSYFFRMWIAEENNVRCRWQFYFRYIQAVLQKYYHRTSYITIIPSPKQWIGRGVYKMYKAYYEKCIKTNEDIHIPLLQI